MPLSRKQKFFTALAALLYVSSGCLHFLQTGAFTRIVPPYLPAHRVLVYVSGIAEIAGGLGLLIPGLRRLAAWGLVVLLVAVFPANLYMATSAVQVTANSLPPFVLWARLPLQLLLIWWVLAATSTKAHRRQQI